MAAASAAIDRGVPIDTIPRTDRRSSWKAFKDFYNRAKLQDLAVLVARLSDPASNAQ